jgi:hypothetical protein
MIILCCISVYIVSVLLARLCILSWGIRVSLDKEDLSWILMPIVNLPFAIHGLLRVILCPFVVRFTKLVLPTKFKNWFMNIK